MRVIGGKFIGIFRQDERNTTWIGFLTWRLGFRGPYIVRGRNETDIRNRVLR
jgi:hypothetical protein